MQNLQKKSYRNWLVLTLRKKTFVRNLSKLLLFNTRLNTAEKNLKSYKNCHRSSIKTMARTKAFVRRVLPHIPQGRIANKKTLNRRLRYWTTLPKTLTHWEPDTCSESWAIQNSGIFRTRGILRTLSSISNGVLWVHKINMNF